MATVSMDIPKPSALTAAGHEAATAKTRGGGEGLGKYYNQHIQDLLLAVQQRINDLSRLEAQRNDLNSQGKRAGSPETLDSRLYSSAYLGGFLSCSD
jgi:26S proteasome regulatory subunit T6